MDDRSGKQAIEYGTVPIDVMASMSGLDFVAAILLDSAMGLAVQSTLPAGAGYTTLEFKISFVRGMSETSGVIRTEGHVLNAGRRVATAEARITDAKDRLLAHATTTCLVLEFPKGSAKG